MTPEELLALEAQYGMQFKRFECGSCETEQVLDAFEADHDFCATCVTLFGRHIGTGEPTAKPKWDAHGRISDEMLEPGATQRERGAKS